MGALSESEQHPGYIGSVADERNAPEAEELILPSPPAPTDDSALSKRIFNNDLTKEFNERYRQAFGQTDAQQNYNQPSRISDVTMDGGPTSNVEVDDTKQRDFGGYMLRRLAEYHLDNYAKNDPGVRPAYEFKERVSSVKAEVAPGYKIDGKYSISGNMFETKVINPYVRSKATIEFGNTGPSHQPETTYNVGRDVTPTIAVDSYYKQNQDQVSLVGTKKLSPVLTASLTGSAIGKRNFTTGTDGEKVVLAGLTWNY